MVAEVSFQFFPSCCDVICIVRDSLDCTLQLFQFFPSCCGKTTAARYIVDYLCIPFNSFPVAVRRDRTAGDIEKLRLSILSQLLSRALILDWDEEYALSILSQLLSRLCHAASL